MLVSLNGRFVDASDAKVSLFDRGYLFGDSVFETLRAYEGTVFQLDRHLHMLERSATALGISGLAMSSLRAHVAQCVARSGLAEAYVRVTISRGEGPPGLGISGCDTPTTSVIVRELHRYPAEGYARGIDSSIVRTPKVPASCLDPEMKTGNYLSTIMARRELATKNQVEGVQLSIDGYVVSGTISNIFLVTGGVLRTPDAASGCRPGVTRAVVLELANELEIKVREEKISADDLMTADEVFFTNTLMECLPVSTIDEKKLPASPGSTCVNISKVFKARVAREVAQREPVTPS